MTGDQESLINLAHQAPATPLHSPADVAEEIKEWHFHIYFFQDNAQQKQAALDLRTRVLGLVQDGFFKVVPLFRVNDRPIGPHPVGKSNWLALNWTDSFSTRELRSVVPYRVLCPGFFLLHLESRWAVNLDPPLDDAALEGSFVPCRLAGALVPPGLLCPAPGGRPSFGPISQTQAGL